MKSEKERFFDKVKTGENCWEWSGSLAQNGYGQFFRKQGTRQAHRIAWEYENGEIPQDLHVCHICDNRKCVRPSHLFLGTRSDNMKDMVSKNRHNTRPGCMQMLKVRKIHIGTSNHEHILTENQAMLAKSAPKIRGVVTKLAKLFGVSLTVISGIRNGKRWVHLPAPTNEKIKEAEEFLKNHNILTE